MGFRIISALSIIIAASAAPQNVCWSGNEDPMTQYTPYFDMYATEDCAETAVDDDLSQRRQCGKTNYGKDKDMYLNWAYGSDHASPTAPQNWKALDKVGNSLNAPDGMMFALFSLGQPGSLRDAHWHDNALELSYIISGTARVTVTGLPKNAADFGKQQKSRVPSNLRGSAAPRGSSVELDSRVSDTFLLKPGDAFISPVGYHHYFEGVDPNDPLIGLAIFDTSDLRSFDLPQMMKNLPDEIIARVLGLGSTESAEEFYKGPRRVLSDPNPTWSPTSLSDVVEISPFKIAAINTDLVPAPRQDRNGSSATKAVNAATEVELGTARMSIAYTEIAPGASLEPYWMDDADEVLYVIEGYDISIVRSGNGRPPVGEEACLDTFTVEEGYLAMNEIGRTTTLTNNGETTAKVLRMFNANAPTLSTLYDSWTGLPEDVIKSMMYEY